MKLVRLELSPTPPAVSSASSMGSVPAANLLAAAWDQNAALRVMSPVAVVLEDVAIAWLDP
jgi:hypothetical protein